MVSATGSAASSNTTNILLNTTTPSVTDTSFTEQLATALEKYLGKLQGGSQLEIDIQPASSQNSGTGQFLVTVKAPTAPAPSVPATRTLMEASTAGVTTPPVSKPPVTVTGQPVTNPPASAGSSPANPSPANPSPTNAAPANEVDAYWATQPPEVQALRNIPDDGDRMTAAHQLASKGYAIDVPIMVWGWDPLTTMMIRQNYGYTWVPSATQANIVAGPGISFPGVADYDPKAPPAGSIKVTTDFAKGLESTSPWYRTFTS